MGGGATEEALEGHFYSEHADKSIHRRHLPHWGQEATLCFITFRLADSLPAGKLLEWQTEKEDWLRRHPRPWNAADAGEYAERFPWRMERWLDAGHGECILRCEAARTCMDGVFARSEGNRCPLHAYVVMPNHVHVLCELRARSDLPELMKEWKGVSAHLLNRLLGRRGTVWQSEYHDRLIRNGEHYRRAVEYVRKNWESVWGNAGVTDPEATGTAGGMGGGTGGTDAPSVLASEDVGSLDVSLGARTGEGTRSPSGSGDGEKDNGNVR